MPKFAFFILDITYRVLDGVPAIFLFGRSESGEQCCVIMDFRPYFYAVGNTNSPDVKILNNLSADGFGVVGVEPVDRLLLERPVKAFKIFSSEPRGVPSLSKSVRDVGFRTFEYDIPFVRRFLFDSKIVPLTKIVVDAESVVMNFRVPVFRANSVEQVSEDVSNLRVLGVDIESYGGPGTPIDFDKNPILMIALKGENFDKVITWKHFDNAPSFVEFVAGEAEMIDRFSRCINDFKPDVITGYHSDNFDIPYISHRAKKYKISLNVGLDHSDISFSAGANSSAKISGIVHVDMLRVAKRLLGRSLQTDSYKLDDVSFEMLGVKKIDVNLSSLNDVWNNHPENLSIFCEYNLHDARLVHDLFVKVYPMLVELVKIIGLPLFDISRMSFSQLVEWFLLRNASLRGEIAPNKPSFHEEQLRSEKSFVGAFVFEPTPGLYDNICVFDYRSLYPSIIASHNISIGSLRCDCCAVNVPGLDFHFCQKKKGFISSIIEDLISRRARVKVMLKGSNDSFLRARSEVLKVLANSFYGYLGFAPARWYCFECGEATTAFGRYYVKRAIGKAQDSGFKVLYSDTDSLFLLLGEKSEQDAVSFVDCVNKDLPGIMELEYENFYPAGIFVSVKSSGAGAKKKYALVDKRGFLKIRGFETVRRNWSPIAKDLQKKVLEIVLKDKDPVKALLMIRSVVSDLRSNQISIPEVTIFTQLQKNIDEYENVGPHVAAAQKMSAKGVSVGPGTVIRYVVVKGSGRIRDRVGLPEDVSLNDYDGEYYVANQVIPSVESIFAVLGIDKDKILLDSSQSTLSGF